MQMDTNSESVMVRQALAGSKEAFALMVCLHQAPVRCWLARYVRDATAADDLAQEVFVRAYRGLGEFREESSLRGWLLGIARNLAVHYLRTEMRRRQRESHPLVAAAAAWRWERLNRQPPEDDDPNGLLTALRGCLKRLSPAGRQLVDEHYFERESVKSIAARLGRKAATVRMTLFRIRTALGECIRKNLEGHPNHGTPARD